MDLSKYCGKEVNPAALKTVLTIMGLSFSLPFQEEKLRVINERICEVRADIISGNKTTDEINMLLDELESLSLKKRDAQSAIGAINARNELRKMMLDRLEPDTEELIGDIELEEES